MQLAKKVTDGANFSIVLPSDCNAACEFCVWKLSASVSPMYVQQLVWHLQQLGDTVTQISITGGEPTMSPLFFDVIDALRENFRGKVVLTTNGTSIFGKFHHIKGVVNHVNLSRHAVDEVENQNIFKSSQVPTSEGIRRLSENLNFHGIDLTLNRVISPDYDDFEDFSEFVDFAKRVGASSVVFRKNYKSGSLEPVPFQADFKNNAKVKKCPVCETHSYLFRGLPVHFKMAVEEPSDELDYIYEFVYHPDGRLCEDWAGKKEVEYIYQTAQANRSSIEPARAVKYGDSCAAIRPGGARC
jgi:MoaA/NifB/PqqE/SkfB family radical SAM enzyme